MRQGRRLCHLQTLAFVLLNYEEVLQLWTRITHANSCVFCSAWRLAVDRQVKYSRDESDYVHQIAGQTRALRLITALI